MDYNIGGEIIERFFLNIKRLVFPTAENNYTSKFLQSNYLLVFVCALLLIKITSAILYINIPANIFFADITKSTLENLVNNTRINFGIPALKENDKLSQSARLKAENMIAENYFSHISPSGITPWHWITKSGYNYHYAGENLAIGFYESEEAYNAWLNSPTHRDNILNSNFTEFGTAVLRGYGGNDTVVVVQQFASPLAVQQELPVKTTNSPTPEPNIAPKPNIPSKVGLNPDPELESTTINEIAKEIEQTPINQTIIEEQVLSETTEFSIESLKKNAETGIFPKIMNYALYSHASIIQNITYGVSLIVMAIIITLIFSSFDLTLKKQLVFRAVIVMLILSLITITDKDVIISLLPHQTII